jgi:hypothetical protein
MISHAAVVRLFNDPLHVFICELSVSLNDIMSEVKVEGYKVNWFRYTPTFDVGPSSFHYSRHLRFWQRSPQSSKGTTTQRRPRS